MTCRYLVKSVSLRTPNLMRMWMRSLLCMSRASATSSELIPAHKTWKHMWMVWDHSQTCMIEPGDRPEHVFTAKSAMAVTMTSRHWPTSRLTALIKPDLQTPSDWAWITNLWNFLHQTLQHTVSRSAGCPVIPSTQPTNSHHTQHHHHGSNYSLSSGSTLRTNATADVGCLCLCLLAASIEILI